MEIANQLIWLNHDPSKQSTFAVVWYLKDHPSLMETPYTFKIMEHNILFNLFTKPQEHQYQIPTYQNNALLNRKKWQIADIEPSPFGSNGTYYCKYWQQQKWPYHSYADSRIECCLEPPKLKEKQSRLFIYQPHENSSKNQHWSVNQESNFYFWYKQKTIISSPIFTLFYFSFPQRSH